MATAPGTSLASLAWRRAPSICDRACATLPWAHARPAAVLVIDAAAAMAAAPLRTSRRLCGVSVMCGPSSGPGRSVHQALVGHPLLDHLGDLVGVPVHH